MTDTLLGRNETVGSTYPMWLDRVIFILAIVGFVFLNQYMWEAIGSTWLQWVASVGLAILLLIMTEVSGRIIQMLRANG
ncbi:MAG: hypothetical protein ISR25_03100 [Candidatus Poseidoniaceae archaeon]|nr:hypothetical protein [Candidatus Poseidoniaceae archaeon]MBL6889462.1 hypothetical protein [Candidatus Poseidoniaceae archaeon]